jgi:hypothetical protein
VLTAWGSCSPSLWTGNSDGALPYAAQGSPFSPFLDMTPAAGQTFTVAYGRRFGAFCHSTIHDSNNSHNATFFWQTRSRLADGGLITTLPPG